VFQQSGSKFRKNTTSAFTFSAGYTIPVINVSLSAQTGHDSQGELTYSDPGVLWPQRQRASGARLPPTGPGHFINLLVVIRPADSGGTATGMVVDYTASGQQYRLTTPTALQVVVNSQCP
jgi:hypothetical protein